MAEVTRIDELVELLSNDDRWVAVMGRTVHMEGFWYPSEFELIRELLTLAESVPDPTPTGKGE